MSKEFVTAALAASQDDEAATGAPIEFKVDGEEFIAQPPTEGQIAAMLVGAGDMSNTSEKVASAINFFFSVLDPDDIPYFKKRLFDRNDPFGAASIAEIVAWLVEEWSGRPIKQPSDFTRSQRSGGAKSTVHRRHRAATQSSSDQTVSAT